MEYGLYNQLEAYRLENERLRKDLDHQFKLLQETCTKLEKAHAEITDLKRDNIALRTALLHHGKMEKK